MTGMDELPIGVLGENGAGSDVGRVVESVDDAEKKGGYEVVTYAEAERSTEGFDAWVRSMVEGDWYLEELGWRVQWQERA